MRAQAVGGGVAPPASSSACSTSSRGVVVAPCGRRGLWPKATRSPRAASALPSSAAVWQAPPPAPLAQRPRNQQQQGPHAHAPPPSPHAEPFTSHSWLAQAVPAIVRHLAHQKHRGGQPEPFVEFCFAEGQQLSFLSQDLQPDQHSVQYWRDWVQDPASNGAAAMVFVRPISNPADACPIALSHASSSAAAAAAAQPACSRTGASVQRAPAEQLELGGTVFQGQEVVELNGSIDLDDCCKGHSAAASAAAMASTTTTTTTSTPRPTTTTAATTGDASIGHPHHPQSAVPPHLSHIVPFYDPRQPGGGASASAAMQAEGMGGPDMELGIPGARSRRRFRARLRPEAAASSSSSSSSSSLERTHALTAGGASCTRPEVAYYGLVALSTADAVAGSSHGGFSPFSTASMQSGHAWPSPMYPTVDGCYVLKTSESKDAGGCTCTLFTLTRVCHGQPLYQQLQDSWLASARQ